MKDESLGNSYPFPQFISAFDNKSGFRLKTLNCYNCARYISDLNGSIIDVKYVEKKLVGYEINLLSNNISDPDNIIFLEISTKSKYQELNFPYSKI